jgi:hypothetical protein
VYTVAQKGDEGNSETRKSGMHPIRSSLAEAQTFSDLFRQTILASLFILSIDEETLIKWSAFMIHHISIDAHDPLRVANVLAEIWKGKAYRFFYSNSYSVMPFDRYGTAVVVFPQGTVWTPGTNTQSAHLLPSASTNLVAIHAAISVPTTQQQIEQIGQREGWRVLTRAQGDGSFRLVEFWVENRILFEFLPPGFEAQYLQTMQPEIIEQILGQPIQSAAA